MLENEIKEKLVEVENLTGQISNLQKELEQSELQRQNEKETCKNAVTSLTKSLNDVTQKLQQRIDQCIDDSQNRENTLKKFYSSMLEQKEEEYKKSILDVEDRLQKEICMMMMNSTLTRRCKSGQKLESRSRIMKTKSVNFKYSNKKLTKDASKPKRPKKIRTKTQILTDENVSLRNRIIKLQSQLTAEKCFLHNEVDSLKARNADLTNELDALKKKYFNVHKEADKLKFENGILNTENNLNSNKLNGVMKHNKEVVTEIAALKQQYQDLSKSYKAVTTHNEQLTRQKHMLEVECEGVQMALEEFKSNIFSKLPLNKYDHILKENIVLKDLLKHMKSEKFKVGSSSVSEVRIQKLEQLVDVLKKRSHQE
ncbi:hypothetical protein FQR65_LT03576 [Abscondita terminalis]|nr:hypothetical protein FQR65_LT03576 [Abscondita terminalis]